MISPGRILLPEKEDLKTLKPVSGNTALAALPQ